MKFSQTTIAKFKIEAGKTEHIEFDEGMPGFGMRIRVGSSRRQATGANVTTIRK